MRVVDLFLTPDGRSRAFDLLFNFDGRITRSSYWLSWLLWAIAYVALFILSFLLGWLPYLMICLWLIVGLLALNSNIAVGRKRLHDRGKSGWWLLPLYLGPTACEIAGRVSDARNVFSIVAFGLFAWTIIELGLLPGTKGQNEYGPDPTDLQAQTAA
ncbi:DUF805 domain-containing protein [Bradyrhizobium guangdongense]|uniref:DUF805 domain-containing protein n=1 Tax=Bradyrhizobium guangdongense TaxID=1325090 RepID=UPI0016433A3D|nr:DUF805 domain-containing protein [Bradyrhizobium guangdongense]